MHKVTISTTIDNLSELVSYNVDMNDNKAVADFIEELYSQGGINLNNFDWSLVGIAEVQED